MPVKFDPLIGSLKITELPTLESGKYLTNNGSVPSWSSIGTPFDFKGVIACAANPNYPAATAADVYVVSTAGKIGGASGVNVEVNDSIICLETTVAGDHATVGSKWSVQQGNIDGAVVGPASATDGAIPLFDTTTGKLIKNSAYTPGSFATSAQGSAADSAYAAAVTNATDANTASTIVKRSGAGAFSAGAITTDAQMTSSLAIGTSPFAVTSTTVNTNLNADMLDGIHSASFRKIWTIGPAGSNANYVCDGTADDVEFNAAVAAATAGDMIFILPGTYVLTAQTLVSKQLTIQGASRESVICQVAGTPSFRIQLAAAGTKIIGVTHRHTTSWDGGAVHFDAPNCTVRDCIFNNSTNGARGLEIALANQRVEDCIFDQYLNYGITFSDGAQNIIIRGCRFLSYNTTAILLQRNIANGDFVIDNNYIWASYGIRQGVVLDASGSAVKGLRITNNHFRCGTYAILLDHLNTASPTSSSNVYIAGNNFEVGYHATAPICLRGVNYASIVGNDFAAAGASSTALIVLDKTTAGSLPCANVAIVGNAGDASASFYAVNETASGADNTIMSGNKWNTAKTANVLFTGTSSKNYDVSTLNVAVKVGTYTLTTADDFVSCTGTFAVNLPAATGSGKRFYVKSINGTITVTPNGADTIDGNATVDLVGDGTSMPTMVVVDTAAAVWRII